MDARRREADPRRSGEQRGAGRRRSATITASISCRPSPVWVLLELGPQGAGRDPRPDPRHRHRRDRQRRAAIGPATRPATCCNPWRWNGLRCQTRCGSTAAWSANGWLMPVPGRPDGRHRRATGDDGDHRARRCLPCRSPGRFHRLAGPDTPDLWRRDCVFAPPAMAAAERDGLYAGWQRAVARITG